MAGEDCQVALPILYFHFSVPSGLTALKIPVPSVVWVWV